MPQLRILRRPSLHAYSGFSDLISERSVMEVRAAQTQDAEAMSALLEDLVAANMRTNPSDSNHVRAHYIHSPLNTRCSVAVDSDESILGFQSLTLANETNHYGTPVGWGTISH